MTISKLQKNPENSGFFLFLDATLLHILHLRSEFDYVIFLKRWCNGDDEGKNQYYIESTYCNK